MLQNNERVSRDGEAVDGSGGGSFSVSRRQEAEQQRFPLNQCRKVFVQRDYTQGLCVRFYTRLPPQLENYVDERIFEKTVTELNRLYEAAEKVGTRSVCETLAGCLSCYLSHLCISNQYEQQLKTIGKYLREQNELVYLPRALFLTDPVERGLRVLEISILGESATAPRPQCQ